MAQMVRENRQIASRHREVAPAPIKTPLAYSVRDACDVCGIGRTSIYAAIKGGALLARKHRRRTVILAADLEAFLRGLPMIGRTNKMPGAEEVGSTAPKRGRKVRT
jgi:hypothetical protein